MMQKDTVRIRKKESRILNKPIIKKVILKPSDIVSKPAVEYNYHAWYPTKTIHFRNVCSLIISGVNCGCGLAQLYGSSNLCNYFGHLSDEDLVPIIKELKEVISIALCTASNLYSSLPNNERKCAGGIIATLGGSSMYDNNRKVIERLGFEKIADYPNYHHDLKGKEIQTLYILKL